eukprot:4806503-Ditylum_brightwellii.AAC.1
MNRSFQWNCMDVVLIPQAVAARKNMCKRVQWRERWTNMEELVGSNICVVWERQKDSKSRSFGMSFPFCAVANAPMVGELGSGTSLIDYVGYHREPMDNMCSTFPSTQNCGGVSIPRVAGIMPNVDNGGDEDSKGT